MKTFSESVEEVVMKIPKGKVMSYKEVAGRAGHPKAVRAVANTMARNLNRKIPCHRVVLSNGKLGGYNRGGEEAKRLLLRKEGVIL